MKNQIVLVLIFLSIQSSAFGQVSFGRSTKINEGWYFSLVNPENAGEKDYDHTKWRKLDLPHDWSVEGTLSPSLASCTGFLPGGIGWYRKTLDLSNLAAEEKVYLYFEGIYNRSEIYVNGKLVGKRPNGYISFIYDISSFIERQAGNILAIKVDHSKSADSRWYTGSGIYRNVWLVTSGRVHFATWGVFYTTPEVTDKSAAIDVSVEVENESEEIRKVTLENVLLSSDGVGKITLGKKNFQIGPKSKAVQKQRLEVNKPILWHLDNPYLYRLNTRMLINGKLVDETWTNVGIRTIGFDPDKGFSLNGSRMKIKGVCIHHDAGCLGSAVPKEVWKQRFQTLKEIGCNGIRLSHNPQAPDVYDLCDELGLLVIDEAFDEWEFPKKKWLEGWNVGTPGFQGSSDFFEEWSSIDIADMVRRDRNHPSVIMWSIGNEVDYPNDPYSHPSLNQSTINQPVQGGYFPDKPAAERLGNIARRLAEEVRKNDLSRPVTAALAGVVMSNETGYPGALDVAGYNYTENRYDMDHKKYPQRVLYGSENGHCMEAWKAVKDREFVFAQFLWTGIDYLGESGPWPSRGFYSGLIDFGGFIKPRGHFRRALWSDKPVAYLGTHKLRNNTRSLSMDAWPVWNYEEGDRVRVVAYTNAAKAKLLLNGRQVGDIKSYDEETGIIFWDLPYEKGIIEVTGLSRNDTPESRYQIQSSDAPYALQSESDVQKIDCDNGLARVVVNVRDEKGIPVIISDNLITCTVTGPGKLMGLEASNNSDMGDYNDHMQRAFRGRLLAYVQATGEEGEILINFSSPWLKSSKYILTAYKKNK